MRNLIRRLFGAPRDASEWSAVADWAAAAGHRFVRSRDGSGFVVEPSPPGAGWRLEWGAPQRHFVMGAELRLRADTAATGDLQMLVMTRPLMTLLEQQMFEEFTEATQTRMDDDTPEEMRWLVLYSKVPGAEMGALREHFGALSNLPRAAPRWLEGPLSQQLDACHTWLPDDQPLVLVVHRGRLTLRCGQPQHPEVAAIRAALRLFDAARVAACRVGEEVMQGAIGSERPSSWGPPSAMPGIDAAGP
jgi:hypothetical protein